MDVSSSEAMSSNQHLSYKQQIALQHSGMFASDSLHNSNSSATSTSLPHCQVTDPDLFATLLFDRQRAYRRTSGTPLTSRSTHSKARDISSAAPKQTFQNRAMAPKTRTMSEKQKRRVKGKRMAKTMQCEASSNAKKRLEESKVGSSLENPRESDLPDDGDNIMISNEETEIKEESDETQTIQQLREQLDAANAKIEELQDLLETKQQAVLNDLSTKEDSTCKDSTTLHITNNNIKHTTLKVEMPLPLTPQSPLSLSMLQPAPPHLSSHVSTEEDIKLENVRATYTKVKIRLDGLKAISRKLGSCTKSMDLSNFGEFGVHMKRLREWLQEDEQQQQQK